MLNTRLRLRLTLSGARLLLSNSSSRGVIAYSTTARLFKWKSSRLDHLLANMPKEEPHLKELKEKRMAKRSARAVSQPANITWQVCVSEAWILLGVYLIFLLISASL